MNKKYSPDQYCQPTSTKNNKKYVRAVFKNKCNQIIRNTTTKKNLKIKFPFR